VVAHANDPFAVYYNPAGLVLNKKKVITMGATVFDPTVKATDMSITSSYAPGHDFNDWADDFETDGDLLVNPCMGFSMPITDQLGFGIAAYAPYGLDIEWDRDYTQNPGALYAWHSKYVREVITPGIGYQLSDSLSLGVSVSLGRSVSEAGKTYPTSPDRTELELILEDSFNYSFNVGLMYRPVEALSLGLTYRSRTETDFKGDVRMNGTKVSTATMEYDHPECIQGGLRYFFSKTFSMECDLLWTRWSINDVQVEESPMAPGGAFLHERDWTDEFQYKIGLEWRAFDSFVFRSGYTYDPTPVPDETFDFGWPDTDRNIYNVGFGWTISEHWSVDGVIQYVRSTSVRHIDGNSSELNSVYGNLVNQLTGDAIPAESVSVSVGDEGILWGYGLNINYSF
jgi:long-chain fatty acid transport protein